MPTVAISTCYNSSQKSIRSGRLVVLRKKVFSLAAKALSKESFSEAAKEISAGRSSVTGSACVLRSDVETVQRQNSLAAKLSRVMAVAIWLVIIAIVANIW